MLRDMAEALATRDAQKESTVAVTKRAIRQLHSRVLHVKFLVDVISNEWVIDLGSIAQSAQNRRGKRVGREDGGLGRLRERVEACLPASKSDVQDPAFRNMTCVFTNSVLQHRRLAIDVICARLQDLCHDPNSSTKDPSGSLQYPPASFDDLLSLWGAQGTAEHAELAIHHLFSVYLLFDILHMRRCSEPGCGSKYDPKNGCKAKCLPLVSTYLQLFNVSDASFDLGWQLWLLDTDPRRVTHALICSTSPHVMWDALRHNIVLQLYSVEKTSQKEPDPVGDKEELSVLQSFCLCANNRQALWEFNPFLFGDIACRCGAMQEAYQIVRYLRQRDDPMQQTQGFAQAVLNLIVQYCLESNLQSRTQQFLLLSLNEVECNWVIIFLFNALSASEFSQDKVQALLYQCLVSWRRLSAAYHEAVGMDGKDFPTGNFVQLLRESLPEAALHVP